MLKALIQSLENKPLNPWPLVSNESGEEPHYITCRNKHGAVNGITFIFLPEDGIYNFLSRAAARLCFLDNRRDGPFFFRDVP
jgi:hypothetical protein